MKIALLKSKLHTARITHTEIDYEGSCGIDQALLDCAGINEYEKIDVYNLNNGERFTTYAVAVTKNSGIVSLLGAAAHKASVNDRVIICSYAHFEANEASLHKPTLVYLDENNRVTEVKNDLTRQNFKTV